MKFFFPDSQDLVSPAYDFARDEYPAHRVRQRDDLYAHEVLNRAPYDGILVSKSIVDGSIKGSGKYTSAQRARLLRMGVKRFFRLPPGVESLGDNGAFNYVDEAVPPVTPAETLAFYDNCGFDAGVSTDHIIFGYDAELTEEFAPIEWTERRALTLRYAEEFIGLVLDQKSVVEPVGAAQGWSPASYADSVRTLEDMGYTRIALGGMVPLQTKQILACLEAIAEDRATRLESSYRPADLHLLGITRIDSMEEFARLGVTSFDSTSSFRQAFMDEKKNYHTADGAFVALRVPQVDGNPALKRAILAGTVSQTEAVAAERETLRALRAFTGAQSEVSGCLDALGAYMRVCGTKDSYLAEYERTLSAAPWLTCTCGVCSRHGIEIAIFRGTERNKRRGFHNLAILADRMAHLPTASRKTLHG